MDCSQLGSRFPRDVLTEADLVALAVVSEVEPPGASALYYRVASCHASPFLSQKSPDNHRETFSKAATTNPNTHRHYTSGIVPMEA